MECYCVIYAAYLPTADRDAAMTVGTGLDDAILAHRLRTDYYHFGYAWHRHRRISDIRTMSIYLVWDLPVPAPKSGSNSMPILWW